MNRRPGYLVFGVFVALAYAALSIVGWEWGSSATRGPRGVQGLSTYRGGK